MSANGNAHAKYEARPERKVWAEGRIPICRSNAYPLGNGSHPTGHGFKMLGLFNIFGRAESLKALDQAFRQFDVHPRLVPEAVKLATVRLLQRASNADYVLRDADYEKAAELLSYAILGSDQFVASNTLAAADRAEIRLDEAIASGDSIDAKLILLAVHSGVIHPTMADQLDSEANE